MWAKAATRGAVWERRGTEVRLLEEAKSWVSCFHSLSGGNAVKLFELSWSSLTSGSSSGSWGGTDERWLLESARRVSDERAYHVFNGMCEMWLLLRSSVRSWGIFVRGERENVLIRFIPRWSEVRAGAIIGPSVVSMRLPSSSTVTSAGCSNTGRTLKKFIFSVNCSSLGKTIFGL